MAENPGLVLKLSMKFVLLINLKLLTTANSFLLNIAEHKSFINSEPGVFIPLKATNWGYLSEAMPVSRQRDLF